MIWPDDEDPTEEIPLFTDEELKELNKYLGEPLFKYDGWLPKEYPCTCGSQATYGPNGLHSQWCDRLRI